VRELENAIEGAVIMAKTEVVNKRDIPNIAKFDCNSPGGGDGKSLKRVVEEPEREHIISVLNECNWSRSKAAVALGVNRTTLYNKMREYDLLDK